MGLPALREPEVFIDARNLLVRAGHQVGSIYRVDSPGDACEDATVILFTGLDRRPWTARVRLRGAMPVVDVSRGWD